MCVYVYCICCFRIPLNAHLHKRICCIHHGLMTFIHFIIFFLVVSGYKKIARTSILSPAFIFCFFCSFAFALLSLFSFHGPFEEQTNEQNTVFLQLVRHPFCFLPSASPFTLLSLLLKEGRKYFKYSVSITARKCAKHTWAYGTVNKGMLLRTAVMMMMTTTMRMGSSTRVSLIA